MPSDLHIHTTFSDGRNTPEEIMEAAKAAGIDGAVMQSKTAEETAKILGLS